MVATALCLGQIAASLDHALSGRGSDRGASYHEKIAERYDHWADLAIFYNKHRNDDPQFAAGFDRATRKVFPQGQESIDVTSLSNPLTDGVMLTGISQITAQAGLKPGNVMVAINGVRISDSKQYFYMMDTASFPKTEIGFWSGENYRTVVLDLPKHRIGGAISDFHL